MCHLRSKWPVVPHLSALLSLLKMENQIKISESVFVYLSGFVSLVLWCVVFSVPSTWYVKPANTLCSNLTWGGQEAASYKEANRSTSSN